MSATLPDRGRRDYGNKDQARYTKWVARQEVKDMLEKERVQLHLLQQKCSINKLHNYIKCSGACKQERTVSR